MAPDSSKSVCANCVTDQTVGVWVTGNHEDAGIKYSTNTNVFTNLFNSNGAACPPTSCSKPDCHCYDTTMAVVNHKNLLATGLCCGNNANEYYKPDWYGGECVSNINFCVWSTGDAQKSGSGNAEWWCYNHEWAQCNDASLCTSTNNGLMRCYGVVGNNAWTPSSSILPEDQTSCSDGIDNDCDNLIDCEDPDCYGTVFGNVHDKAQIGISYVTVKSVFGNTIKYDTTDSNGDYNVYACGTVDLTTTHKNYLPSGKDDVVVPPKANVRVDFTLILGSACEDDCTYLNDNIVHAECDGINNCKFCDSTARAVCDLSQPGWVRDYNEFNYVVCGEGCPQLKVETKASVTCESGTLVKVTRIVSYKGKPVRLVVATCG